MLHRLIGWPSLTRFGLWAANQVTLPYDYETDIINYRLIWLKVIK